MHYCHLWLSADSGNAAPDQGLPPMVRCNLCLPIEMCSHPMLCFAAGSAHAPGCQWPPPTHCTASGWLPRLGLAAQHWCAVPPTSGIERSGGVTTPCFPGAGSNFQGPVPPFTAAGTSQPCTLSFPAHRSAAAPSRLRSIGSLAGMSHRAMTAPFACSGLHSSPRQRRACRRASNELAERASAADITALAPVSPPAQACTRRARCASSRRRALRTAKRLAFLRWAIFSNGAPVMEPCSGSQ